MPALDTPCCTCVAEIESVEHSGATSVTVQWDLSVNLSGLG